VEGARSPGRDSLPALQRVITLVSLLAEAPQGVSADDLVTACGYSGAPEGQREQLARDIRHLSRNGWLISNTAAPGTTAHYRLQPGDPRVRLVFNDAEQTAFERAAQLAGVSVDQARRSSARGNGPEGWGSAPFSAAYVLELALHAQEHRCLMTFRYRDKERVVTPDAVWEDNDRWYLRGRIDGDDPRNFRLDRIEQLSLAAPGSAGPTQSEENPNADPLQFSDGPVVTAEVHTHPDFRRRVERSLGRATYAQRIDDDTLVLTIDVISHLTFLRRLCELGTRVQLVGPESLRQELRDMLAPHRSRA
jgi:predicted DNA-binding transcriptional regulator YafY